MRYEIYTAGKMGNRITTEVIKERRKANKLICKYGMRPLDPGYSEVKDWKGYRISDSIPKAKMRKYVYKDLRMVNHADAVLVMTGDTASDGTGEEKCIARLTGKVVAVVAPARCNGKLMGFTNILYPCFPTMELAIKYIRKELDKRWK